MKLEKIRIKNFRGYSDEVNVNLGDMTAFVGQNDAGKSSILEALDIFFNDGGGIIKMDKNDLNVKQAAEGCKEVEIACVFSDLPETIFIDSGSTETSFAREHMLNSDGLLEIVKRYKMTSESPKATVYIKALHPGNPNCSNLLSETQEELKGILDRFNISCDDRRKCASMRAAIWEHFSKDLCLREDLIDISAKRGQGSDSVWNCLKRVLPVYSLFRSDRKNSDGDSEVQDPLREAVKDILRDEEIQKTLDGVAEKVRARLQDVAGATLAKLKEMNPDVAETLKPQIPSTGDLKWADVFKGLSITGDENIPINKRGSGIRRMILLNFFRAEVERKAADGTNTSVIYAIDEPETSQHIESQRKLISALKGLSKRTNTQIILTTHSSAVVKCLDYGDIRIVKEDHTVSVVKNRGRNTKTLLEINYLVFGDASVEYHNELYGELCKIFSVQGPKDFEKIAKEKGFDAYMKWHNDLTRKDEILTLQSYIRNSIHHPENEYNGDKKYTDTQLSQSIDKMLECLRKLHDERHQPEDLG